MDRFQLVEKDDRRLAVDAGRTSADEVREFVNRFTSMLSQGTETPADPDNVIGHQRSQVPDGQRLYNGVIHFTIPCYGGYRVMLEDLGGPIRCRDGRIATDGAGVKSLLPPGTRVLVAAETTGTSIGTIVGVRPAIVQEAADSFSDFIVQGSGVGLYASPQFTEYVSKTIDAAGGLPYDGSLPYDGLPGDYTVLSETGLGLHIDNDLSYLRASEVCGVFLFREDGHTRVSGESLATESFAVRNESGMAAYENYDCETKSIYPWESLGRTTPGAVEVRDVGAESVFSLGDGVLEPSVVDTIPIDRIQRYGGYLGQGEHTILSCPVGDGVNSTRQLVEQRGLFRQQLMLDGTYLTETVRQMFFCKVASIPVLRQSTPRDYLAEGEKYVYSGVVGDGDPHIVRPLRIPDAATASAGVSDLYAYASAWQGLHPAVYHPHIDVEYAAATGPSITPVLDESDHVTLPSPTQVTVDHRYGDIDIYRVLSLFAFLPDGTVVIRNGLGAEIKLEAAVVSLSGTGVYVNAAKTLSMLANQVSIRGNKYAELVSSVGNVYVKADRNLSLLGGNSGYGGVLIESRSVTASSDWPDEPSDAVVGGVVIKGGTSSVAVYGGDILLKTGGEDTGLNPGRIVMDAAESTITTRSLFFNRFSEIYYDSFGVTGDRTRKTNVYTETFSVVVGSLGISEQLLVGGSCQIYGNYTTLTGHYASTLTQQYAGKVGLEIYPHLIRNNLNTMASLSTSSREQATRDLNGYRDWLQAENRPGNSDTIRNTSFGFPSTQGYRSDNVKLSQPYWQQVIPSGQAWREPTVVYRGNALTRPWPGNARWTESNGFVKPVEGASYFDAQLQSPIDPTYNRETYEQAITPATETVAIADGLKTLG